MPSFLKHIYRKFLSFKHGLTVFIVLLVLVALLIGYIAGQNRLAQKVIPPDNQEQELQKQGLLLNDGIYLVGSEIAPGIYRTKGVDVSVFGCHWQRLSGFGSETNDVIVNYFDDSGGATIVEIASTDKGFRTQGCGKWYAVAAAVVEDSSQFGDGAFVVGDDIDPGLYKAQASQGCYWERLAGFSRQDYHGRLFGKDPELIASNNQAIVEIAATDRGFISRNCRLWQKVDQTD